MFLTAVTPLPTYNQSSCSRPFFARCQMGRQELCVGGETKVQMYPYQGLRRAGLLVLSDGSPNDVRSLSSVELTCRRPPPSQVEMIVDATYNSLCIMPPSTGGSREGGPQSPINHLSVRPDSRTASVPGEEVVLRTAGARERSGLCAPKPPPGTEFLHCLDSHQPGKYDL